MNIVLLGCPGAGKGTQAQFIAKQFGIPQISTGDILRQAIREQSTLGLQVKQIVDAGGLVSDGIMTALVTERLQKNDCAEGFLLDGFPRTLQQLNELDQLGPAFAINLIIDIDVSDEEVVKRLSGRRVHPASGRVYHLAYQPPVAWDRDDITGEPLVQRVDDQEETVRKRLALYHQQTEPLRKNFSKRSGYHRLPGEESVETISAKITEIIHHYLQEIPFEHSLK